MNMLDWTTSCNATMLRNVFISTVEKEIIWKLSPHLLFEIFYHGMIAQRHILSLIAYSRHNLTPFFILNKKFDHLLFCMDKKEISLFIFKES